jgi:hypothetical protein
MTVILALAELEYELDCDTLDGARISGVHACDSASLIDSVCSLLVKSATGDGAEGESLPAGDCIG